MDARPPQWTIFRRTTLRGEPPTRPPWTLPAGPGPLAPPRRRRSGADDDGRRNARAEARKGRIAWPSAPRPERSGDVLNDRYELVSRIGSGGMGEVYAARFLASRRHVAVKLLDPHLAGDPELVARFRHEYLILTRVAHPHLVRAIDMAVTADGQPYFTMELIRGETLEDRLARVGTLAPKAAIELGLQLCGATSALHRAGVIHRDIKPTNVVLAGPSAGLDARLIDLGIAWLSPAYYADTDPYMTPPAARVETGRGLLLGTPGYTPPEAGYGRCGPVHDVFALGVLLYRAVTGRMPFAAPYGACDGQEPRPFAALGLASPPPAGLEEVLLTALALRPGDRLRDVDELAAELACAGEELLRAAGASAPRPDRREAPSGARSSCSKGQVHHSIEAEAPGRGRRDDPTGSRPTCPDRQARRDVDQDPDNDDDVSAHASSRHEDPAGARGPRPTRPALQEEENDDDDDVPRPGRRGGSTPAEGARPKAQARANADATADDNADAREYVDAAAAAPRAELTGASPLGRRRPPHGPERAVQAPHRWPAEAPHDPARGRTLAETQGSGDDGAAPRAAAPRSDPGGPT